MATIKHKSFVGPHVYFGADFFGRNLNGCRDVIRRRAQNFINREIGLDNVISVTEHATTFGPFSVAVWYRDDEKDPKRYFPDDDFD